MQHPIIGGLCELQKYAAVKGFPLEIFRSDVTPKDAKGCDLTWLPPRDFFGEGIEMDLEKLARDESPLRMVSDVSLSDKSGTRQLLFVTIYHDPCGINLLDSFSVLHPHVNGSGAEQDKFLSWFTLNHVEISNIADCGMPNPRARDWFKLWLLPGRYAEQVFAR